MKVTSVRIDLVRSERESITKLKAYAEVVFDNALAVKGMRVLEGPPGTYVAMPARKRPFDGKYVDICHPINRSFHRELETAVLNEYERVLNERETNGPA